MASIQSTRIYIIGAGFAGQTIAQEIKAKRIFGEVVAFLDDDPDKIGRSLDEIPVLGPIRDVAKLLRMNPADEAIIAIPSASREYLRELYAILKKAGFTRIKILPGISQIIEGNAHLIQARSIDPQDLLGEPRRHWPKRKSFLPPRQAGPGNWGRRLHRQRIGTAAAFGRRPASVPPRPW
ncbi:hypothetical protein MASR2M78_31690 [Treponema sp.]